MTTATTTTRVRPLNPERHAARTALLVAASPAWGKGYDRATGEAVALAPSQSEVGKYHRVTADGCDCRGFAYRQMCSHYAAFLAQQDAAARRARVEQDVADLWPVA